MTSKFFSSILGSKVQSHDEDPLKAKLEDSHAFFSVLQNSKEDYKKYKFGKTVLMKRKEFHGGSDSIAIFVGLADYEWIPEGKKNADRSDEYALLLNHTRDDSEKNIVIATLSSHSLSSKFSSSWESGNNRFVFNTARSIEWVDVHDQHCLNSDPVAKLRRYVKDFIDADKANVEFKAEDMVKVKYSDWSSCEGGVVMNTKCTVESLHSDFIGLGKQWTPRTTLQIGWIERGIWCTKYVDPRRFELFKC
jgi:hypothetical protein